MTNTMTRNRTESMPVKELTPLMQLIRREGIEDDTNIIVDPTNRHNLMDIVLTHENTTINFISDHYTMQEIVDFTNENFKSDTYDKVKAQNINLQHVYSSVY